MFLMKKKATSLFFMNYNLYTVSNSLYLKGTSTLVRTNRNGKEYCIDRFACNIAQNNNVLLLTIVLILHEY